jgi:hypothetical protein
MAVLARVLIRAGIGTYALQPDNTIKLTHATADFKVQKAVQKILNAGDSPIEIYWVRANGVEKLQRALGVGEKARFDTFVGHKFHLKKSGTQELLKELEVQAKESEFVYRGGRGEEL